jgi:hypothetical protein
MKRVFLLLFPRGPETLPAARFISFVLAQPAPHPFFLPAGPFASPFGPFRPSALFPSRTHCQAGPTCRARLPPRPSRTLARVRPGHARAAVFPSGPHAKASAAPIKGTRDTLLALAKPAAAALALANPSSQNRRHCWSSGFFATPPFQRVPVDFKSSRSFAPR